jgi:phage terminase large subunit
MEKIIDFKYPSILHPVIGCKKRNIILFGGRGGAKSWFVAAYLIALATQKKDQIILCTREIQNTIKDSVHKLLSDTIERLGLASRFTVFKNEIVCQNGTRFIFKGLQHSIGEIKSTEGINYCWVEEAQKISRNSREILWPTVRVDGSQFFVTYNPENEVDPIHKDFIIEGRDDSLVININYYDNPFFPDVLRKEMEWDRKYNYNLYLEKWEGKCKRISDACIFKDKFSVMSFETPSDAEFNFGGDWGHCGPDPTVLVRNFIKDDCLYIDYEAYGSGVEIDEIPALYDTIPLSREHLIRVDNSLDLIRYVRKDGFSIREARKGPGSVEAGIKFMQNFKMIYIHPRCKNAIFEFEHYSYKTDKQTGEIINIILDKHNHVIDSIRYSLEDVRKGFEAQPTIVHNAQNKTDSFDKFFKQENKPFNF